MAQWKVKFDTKAYTQAGATPTQKLGNFVTTVEAGTTFYDVGNVRGWLAILKNKWVMLSACEPVVEVPPENPPAVRMQERISRDGGVTWEPWTEWEKIE